MVYDPTRDELLWRFRPATDFLAFAGEFDIDFLSAFTQEFLSLVESMGPGVLFKQLDESLSNVLRIVYTEHVECRSPEDLLDSTFGKFVASAPPSKLN